MIPLIKALTEKAQESLMREQSLDILNAAFEIEADPERPDDEGAMQRNVRIEDAFTRDIPWLNGELGILRQICDRYYEDFDRPATTMLRAALLTKRYELEEIKGWNNARPLLRLVTPMVGVWAISWTVTLGGGVAAEVRYREYLNDSAMDAETLAKVRGRLREFAVVMDRILGRLCSAEGAEV